MIDNYNKKQKIERDNLIKTQQQQQRFDNQQPQQRFNNNNQQINEKYDYPAYQNDSDFNQNYEFLCTADCKKYVKELITDKKMLEQAIQESSSNILYNNNILNKIINTVDLLKADNKMSTYNSDEDGDNGSEEP